MPEKNGKVKRIENRSFCLIEKEADELEEKIFHKFEKSHLIERWHNNSEYKLKFQKKKDTSLKDLLFFDVECMSLAYEKPIFLIGTLSYDKKWRIKSFFARDYSEEKAILQYFNEFAKGFKMLFSYNGTSFDANIMKERAYYNSVKLELPHVHIDILPLMRSFKKRPETCLPNYSLKTVEKYLFGKKREDDIEGNQIGNAYKEYVMERKDERINKVIRRNMCDLITTFRAFSYYLSKI